MSVTASTQITEAAERADANFVVHATWALERSPGTMIRIGDHLVIANSGLPCDTFNFICRARLDRPTVHQVGYVSGEPVATAEATVEAGTVGLYNIATRSGFRQRGIGSMMTRRVLHDARTKGRDLAVLQAAAAGVGLYQRLGFVSFGEITEYKPTA
jgi:ribosomal protein S18 acetylase RimI-like enzyme